MENLTSIFQEIVHIFRSCQWIVHYAWVCVLLILSTSPLSVCHSCRDWDILVVYDQTLYDKQVTWKKKTILYRQSYLKYLNFTSNKKYNRDVICYWKQKKYLRMMSSFFIYRNIDVVPGLTFSCTCTKHNIHRFPNRHTELL